MSTRTTNPDRTITPDYTILPDHPEDTPDRDSRGKPSSKVSKEKPSFMEKIKKGVVSVAKNMKKAGEHTDKIATKEELHALAKNFGNLSDTLTGTATIRQENYLTGSKGVKFADFDEMSGVRGRLSVPDSKIVVNPPKFVDESDHIHTPGSVRNPQIRVRTDFLTGDHDMLTGRRESPRTRKRLHDRAHRRDITRSGRYRP
jgi:hypothetical protein